MAELVPNCSHILHFSDEEVEELKRIVIAKPVEPSFYIRQVDVNILIKYPLEDNLKQSWNEYIIQPQNILLGFIRIYDYMQEYNFNKKIYFSYLLLIAMYEKIEFPPYQEPNECYHAVASCLHKLIQLWPDEKENPKTFPEFRKNIYNPQPNFAEINSIFVPIQNKKSKSRMQFNCCIQ